MELVCFKRFLNFKSPQSLNWQFHIYTTIHDDILIFILKLTQKSLLMGIHTEMSLKRRTDILIFKLETLILPTQQSTPLYYLFVEVNLLITCHWGGLVVELKGKLYQSSKSSAARLKIVTLYGSLFLNGILD